MSSPFVFLHGDFDVDLKVGTNVDLETEVLVDTDLFSYDLLHMTLSVSSIEGVIDSKYDATVGEGDSILKVVHEFKGHKEYLRFHVTNKGYNRKTFFIRVYDADTGELVDTTDMDVISQDTRSSNYGGAKNMWVRNGHKNLKLYLMYEGETLEDVPSSCIVTMQGLDEIYDQDILKPDDPEPDRRDEYPRSDDVFDDSAYLPQKIYAKKKAEENKQEMEEKEPEIDQKEDTETKNSALPWFLLWIGGGVLILLLLLFLLFFFL